MARKQDHRDKGTGSLTKRKDGLWVASIELPPGIDGKRRRKTVTRKNRGDAQLELRKLQDLLAKTGDLSTKTYRLADWLDVYLEDIAPSQLSPKALYDRKSVINLFVKPLLGHKPLDRVTADDVRRLHKTILATPRDPKLRGLESEDIPAGTAMLSSSYARNAHNALAAALKAAMREGKITANPCDLVDRPATGRAIDNALTRDQFIRLLRAVNGHKHKAMWLTFLLTGARRGEVAGLELERAQGRLDISWQLKQITAPISNDSKYDYRHIVGKRYLVRPKTTTSWRVFPMPRALAAVYAETFGERKTGFAFTNQAGEPYDPSTIGRMWKKLLCEHGLPSHVTLHGARHTFIDMMMNSHAQVREDVVMQIVGHASRAMLRSYQQNIAQDNAAAALEVMEDLYLEAVADDTVDAEIVAE